MRAALYDALGVVGIGLITWALWDVDTRLARGVLGISLCVVAGLGAYIQAHRR